MVLPLGLVSAFSAWVIWIVVSLVALILSMRVCWKLYGLGSVPRNLFFIVGYAFAPVAACTMAAQMGFLLLLGLVLFLWLEPRHPLLAGLSLILPFAKPHLFSLFWLVLAMWVFDRRNYRLTFGFLLALSGAIAIPLDR